MLKDLSGDSLQVLPACLLSVLFSIAIPAKYKVTESTTYVVSYVLCTYQYDYIVTCHVSNHSRGVYRMLLCLSLASCINYRISHGKMSTSRHL